MNTNQIITDITEQINRFSETLDYVEEQQSIIKKSIKETENPVDSVATHFKKTMDSFTNEQHRQLNRLNKQKDKYNTHLKEVNEWEQAYNHRDVMDDTLEAMEFTAETQKTITKNTNELDGIADKNEYIKSIDSLIGDIHNIKKKVYEKP